ncbi:unnamed protein product, partial [Oppiella nova]
MSFTERLAQKRVGFYCWQLFLIDRLLSSIRLPHIEEFEVQNEPILSYKSGSPERQALIDKLNHYNNTVTDIPIVINGKRYSTNEVRYQCSPFDHKHKLAKFSLTDEKLFREAIDGSQKARKEWEARNLTDKIAIFLRAADLMAGRYKQDLNATTMLGQGKTVIQAEIDAGAELPDFLRFNALYAKDMYKYQPLSPQPEVTTNTFRYRGLEGFVAAVAPFNFTAIGGNLATAPVLMGNVVLYKPATTAVLSNWVIYQILEEAGVPPGVIQFVPSSGPVFGEHALTSPYLSAVNFTGSVGTFRNIWRTVANSLDTNHGFPRLVGECGGKDYHFVHESADVDTVVAQTMRAAFEYSGQKCSACSRLYVPDTTWPKIKEGLLSVRSALKLGTPLEFDTFMTAVIDKNSFKTIRDYINEAQTSPSHTVLGGGKCDDSTGWYIEPTIVETTDPNSRLIREEIFGPVLTVYVYKAAKVGEALDLCDRTSGFALTGSLFAKDQQFIDMASERLKQSAGNFYINDKCTGAVVGQQPFGGARLSGTNDKAGAPHYLLRWCS